MADDLISDAKLRRKKKAQAHISQATGALGLSGLAALGASKMPKSMAMKAIKIVPKSQRKNITRQGLGGASTGLVTTGAGIGGAGSFNFATIQNQESRKRGPQQVKKSHAISAFGIEH